MSKLLTSRELKNLDSEKLELECLEAVELSNQLHAEIHRRAIIKKYKLKNEEEKALEKTAKKSKPEKKTKKSKKKEKLDII
jgi:hypothetical protein